jgi:hypothetical protein
MSQRSQIEWLKFSRLRNKPLITCTDQCEYYCFHIFCSFLSFDSHGPSSGPYEIIVIFYFLSGNLMLVISWRKFGRRDQERRLAQSSGTSLRRGLTACVRTATGVLRKRPVSHQHGRHFSSEEEDVAKLCCLFLLNGNRILQQRFMPEDHSLRAGF